MKLEQFKVKVTNPDFTDQDKEALYRYKVSEGDVDHEEWEVFLMEINEGEWQGSDSGTEVDEEDDSDVEFIEVSEDRYLIRIA